MIDITGVDLVNFIKIVYELSVPQGLGFMHFTDKPLTNEEAKSLIKKTPFILDMDYVKGRACKMNVREKDGKLFIADSWYDHTDQQFEDLLTECNIKHPIKLGEHGMACNCRNCQVKRT